MLQSIRQYLRCLPVLGLAATLAACGGGGGSGPAVPSAAPPAVPPAEATSRPVTQTDLEIARLVYSDSQRTPAGFYSEPDPGWNAQVATFHIKNSDLAALAPDAPRHEVCASDWNEALAWSEQVAQSAPAYSDLVETGGNDHWHEFTRLVRGPDPRYLRMRVYDCGYVDRNGVDIGADDGIAGVLNQRPVTAEALASLSEYLWQFTLFNNFGHAVLASRGQAAAGAIEHALMIASLERGGAGACDLITINAWTHRADPSSGALALATTPLWSFAARENAGFTELCDG